MSESLKRHPNTELLNVDNFEVIGLSGVAVLESLPSVHDAGSCARLIVKILSVTMERSKIHLATLSVKSKLGGALNTLKLLPCLERFIFCFVYLILVIR